MPTVEGDEHELWELARNGDSPARARLCALAHGIAERELARRGARDEVLADLVQESVRSTLAFLSQSGPEPRDLGGFLKFRAWGVLSDHRKRMRTQHVELRDFAEEPRPARGPGPEGPLLQGEIARAVADCRAKLAPGLGAVIEMRYERRLETESIARELGIHRNTVNVRVFRALELLRECLARKGHAPGGLT